MLKIVVLPNCIYLWKLTHFFTDSLIKINLKRTALTAFWKIWLVSILSNSLIRPPMFVSLWYETVWYDMIMFFQTSVSTLSDRGEEQGAVIQVGRLETSRPVLDMIILAIWSLTWLGHETQAAELPIILYHPHFSKLLSVLCVLNKIGPLNRERSREIRRNLRKSCP